MWYSYQGEHLCVYLCAKGECKVWKSDTTSATLILKSTFIFLHGGMEMWPDSIYSVPVTHKEKTATESKLVCVCVCVRVTYGVTTFQAVWALCYDWLVDVSSYNGLLCGTGWWGGEIKWEEGEREAEMGRAEPDIYVKLDFVVPHMIQRSVGEAVSGKGEWEMKATFLELC